MSELANQKRNSTASLGKLGAVAVALAAVPLAAAAEDATTSQAAFEAMYAFSAAPTWMGPESSPPIAEGKFVIDIPCMQAAIGCSRPGDAFLEAAEALGWKTQLIDPAGDPGKLQAAVKTAIQQGADGIFLPGGNISALGETLKMAKDAGIVMITMAGEGNPVGPDAWDANIYENTLDYGKAAAAYIATNTPGAHILTVNDSEFAEIDALFTSFNEAIAEYCPTCEITRNIDFSIVNVTTTMPQQVKAALQAEPSINWILGPYDFASAYIAQAVAEIGKADDVDMISWGGHPQNMQMISEGMVQSATVAVAEEWIGYAAADQMNRLFNGEPIWTEIKHNKGSDLGSQNYGEQIVYDANLPGDLETNWNSDFDFRAKYREIWGLN